MKPRVEKSKVYVLQYCPAILIVFCKALLADRIGTAFVFCKSLLADRIGTATSWMRFECTKHSVFSGKRRFRCGEKLAHVRDGCGRPL